MKQSRDLDTVMTVVAVPLALALAAGVLLTGCAPPLVPLAPVYNEANADQARIATQGATITARAKAELAAEIARCPVTVSDRRVCAIFAQAGVAQLYAGPQALQTELESRYSTARTALAAAATCRDAGDEACVAEQRAIAIGELAQIERLLGPGPASSAAPAASAPPVVSPAAPAASASASHP